MQTTITYAQRRKAFLSAITDSYMTVWLAMAGPRTGGPSTKTSNRVMLSAILFSFFATSTSALAQEEGGCASQTASNLLTFVQYTADFLIGVGAGASVLLFSIGALFIMFGVTPQRVNKGTELIKQTAIGLGILASGVFIREVVVSFVFQRSAEVESTC